MPLPTNGEWTGYRTAAAPSGRVHRIPLRLQLRFASGAVLGVGGDPGSAFDVFGLYGERSGHCAMILTDLDGSAIDLEGEQRGGRIVGTWLDEGDGTGSFAIWPVAPSR